ncbi:glycoside hydrolase family 125 protein [Olivibacter ginsenosidimutans]|uniref:Glycoside hydrolase family 125 protein n=1 Tax=Olivibacter ginsenosidimutans TaxID=1176537 RepID=A0ABP9C8X2_9SPHI
MERRSFIKSTVALGAGYYFSNNLAFGQEENFPAVRVAENMRNFTSEAVEGVIKTFQSKVKNKELAWLFGNCFPNTLDTTVFFQSTDGVPDTYVITGDIDAMWLRDSSAQVWPYLALVKEDKHLADLIAGVINRQTDYVLKDPYANAFYDDPEKVGEWAKDKTDMRPGVHERKWEIDSLCYPIRLAYHYWKETKDTTPFNAVWKEAIQNILKTFKEQQRKDGNSPYHFERVTGRATDTLPMDGYGYPVKPVGLICSSFRPSDDATVLSFLIPSNFFAVVSLKQAAEMVKTILNDNALANELAGLAKEVETALDKYAKVKHPKYGDIYAFEVDGYGGHLLMDDANVPSLLALPYLGAVKTNDPVYVNTRKFILSEDNPFFYKGTAGEGVGGPHIGKDMIWPMSIIIRALTSTDDKEIKHCIQMLQKCHGGKGFMHESFHKDDPTKFTRSWFAWTNTLFGELLWETYQRKKSLLS